VHARVGPTGTVCHEISIAGPERLADRPQAEMDVVRGEHLQDPDVGWTEGDVRQRRTMWSDDDPRVGEEVDLLLNRQLPRIDPDEPTMLELGPQFSLFAVTP
jgi:hypothetical protein